LNATNVALVRETIRRLHPDVVFSCGSDGIGFSTYHAAIDGRVASLTYLGDTWLGQAWRCLPAYDPWVDVATGGRRPGFRKFLKRSLAYAGRFRGLLFSEKPPRFAPVTVISPFVLDDLRASGAPAPEKVPFTYVPLNRAFFNEQNEPIGHDDSHSSSLRALFVSRVEKLKGPDTAIAGVAAAVKSGVDVQLTIAGMSLEKLRPELEMQGRELGILDRIAFAGTPPLEELIKLYRGHDVFLFPSRIVEGLGLVNCEAQACGLPIIGTADSGAAEVIRHGETGFRIAINDQEAIGRHLGELAADRGLWERMSAKALESAKRFHPERILDTLEAALYDVVQA
jgi:glycosyltransferase involved in cell wall biosynthesis